MLAAPLLPTMPSRRTLLASAAAAGAATLAGCSTSGSLDPATHGNTPTPPDGSTVVATAERFTDPPPPNGAFRLSASVHERVRDGDRELHLFTEHGLIPGENQHANNGWRLAELGVEHNYGGALATGSGTNFRRTEPGESGSVRLGRTATDDGRRWTLRFPDTGDSTWGATFVTELDPERSPDDGETIADIRTRVREAKSWSFRAFETELTAELVYGADR
jgi:hypothetical protein